MENEQATTSSESSSSNNKSMPLIIGIVLLIVICTGYYLYNAHKSQEKSTVISTMTQKSDAPKRTMNPAMMKATKPAPLTDQQQQELTNGTSSATTQKTFDMSAGNFWFVPNKITVNKGDRVTVVFAPKDGFHDFVIDEFQAKAGPVLAGKTASVTFTASKSGTFQFYCSIDHHRQKGQVGTLIVQ